MHADKLICRICNEEYPLDNIYSCPKCGGILEVHYDDHLYDGNPVLNPDKDFQGMWKYRALLPVKDPKNIVSLGEGDTPILKAERVAEKWGSNLDIYVKAELLNPSGSFKDRPTSVGVSIAKEKGYKKIVIASSGNASASASAYAARAGMECVVFVPETTDPNKVIQAQSYGAEVYSVPGNYSRSYEVAKLMAEKNNWANVTSTFINPYTVEGDKVPAYELYHQLNGRVPDAILIPIGSGPLLVGIFKGFKDLLNMGLIDHLPAMVGVQVDACKPITEAYENKALTVRPWKGEIITIAGGISDPLQGYEKDGELCLRTVLESNGCMVSLSEEEVRVANEEVEKLIGLYSEPTGAVSLGAVHKLEQNGFLKSGQLTVSFLTGHGFKFSKRHALKPKLIKNVEEFN